MIAIKIGGSLIGKAKEILEIIKGKDTVIIPGGGIFADFIREKQKELGFSDNASHHMAILSMEQYGYYLHDLSGMPTEAEITIRSGPYIFLPSRFVIGHDPFPYNWKVTSDTIGLYISYNLEAEKYIILTDVPGIMDDGEVLEEIDIKILASMGETCVDEAFVKYYKKYFVDTWIIDGTDPEKVKEIFKGKYSGTHIVL